MTNNLKFVNKLFISFLIFCFSNINAQVLEKNNEMIVAFYGRPNAPALGVLGQHSVDDLLPILNSTVNQYKAHLPNTKITPAFDIIYGLATADPGADGSYLINLSDEKLQPYIKLAEEQGYLLFLDLQLGKFSPLQAVNQVLPYLKYKNVHIAIDPEFEAKGLSVGPGKVIGSINGNDVNAVQEAMKNYIEQEQISGNKYLMIHNFTEKMVTNKAVVQDYDRVNLIMNLDGHGSPELKIKIYNGLYQEKIAARVDGGFKLFYKQDSPMMTPSQVLGKESVGGFQMAIMPRFINFQ